MQLLLLKESFIHIDSYLELARKKNWFLKYKHLVVVLVKLLSLAKQGMCDHKEAVNLTASSKQSISLQLGKPFIENPSIAWLRFQAWTGISLKEGKLWLEYRRLLLHVSPVGAVIYKYACMYIKSVFWNRNLKLRFPWSRKYLSRGLGEKYFLIHFIRALCTQYQLHNLKMALEQRFEAGL